jgi:Ca-activated chloride channel homolog
VNHFVHPHFAEPVWLWLAGFGPVVLLALFLYSAHARHRRLAQLAEARFLPELTRSHSWLRRSVKELALLICVAGIGLALARPQWGEQELGGHLLGGDVLFVLDCSSSMLASDVAPSRLQRARLSIMDFVQRRGRGRVGLVAFSGQAFLQCPLTFDYGAFEEALMSVGEKTIPIPGTDIGRALDEATRAMNKDDKQKTLVLVSDGEDLERTGIAAAKALARQGVIVFTVGVGTPFGAEIQIVTETGKRDFLRDKDGIAVRSRLDSATLQEIARAGGGAYYPFGGAGEGLTRVRLTLDNPNSSFGVGPSRKLGIDRFHVPVAIVLVLLVAESLLGTRRRLKAVARG